MISPSGHTYIGVTSNISKRKQAYKGLDCKNQPRILKSLTKYGFESHNFTIIDSFNSTIEFAHGKEIFWIRTYMSNCIKYRDKKGLNLTDGGQGTVGYKFSDELKAKLSAIHKANPNKGFLGKKHSEESKEKFRKTMALKKILHPIVKPHKEIKEKKIKVEKKKWDGIVSKETRLKISLAKKGSIPHNKGKPMPEHQKTLLRIINTGRPSPFKGIKFVGTDEERKIKFGKHNIGNSYNKGRKHSIEQTLNLIKIHSKPILQFDLEGNFIKEFASIKDAKESLGLSRTTIFNSISGVTKNPKKFIFKYK